MRTAKLRSLGWRWRARRARAQGRYNRQTRQAFFRAWYHSGQVGDALAYALFLRDLGRVTPLPLVAVLQQERHRLKFFKRLLAESLILERTGQCCASPLGKRREKINKKNAKLQLPSALHCHQSSLELTRQQAQLLKIFQRQQAWRQQFADTLSHHIRQGKGVCVVGNAGGMAQSGLGRVIDQHGYVVRFNRFASDNTCVEDMGQTLNVWVLTPNFVIDEALKPDWVILTGPAMEYRLLDWSGFERISWVEIPIITIPLPVWYSLVRELEAPPSAGIVLLAFLYELLGSWEGVAVAGFGALFDQEQIYHYTDKKHQPAGRHNWQCEGALLQRWMGEGLLSLHSQAPE